MGYKMNNYCSAEDGILSWSRVGQSGDYVIECIENFKSDVTSSLSSRSSPKSLRWPEVESCLEALSQHHGPGSPPTTTSRRKISSTPSFPCHVGVFFLSLSLFPFPVTSTFCSVLKRFEMYK